MKFKRYNETTFPKGVNSGTPSISFSKAGTITLNSVAVKALQINDKTRIEFIQDEDRPEDWYILKSSDGGYTLRQQTEKSTAVMIQNKGLITHIAHELQRSAPFRCLVSVQCVHIDDMELWPIITKSAKSTAHAK